MEHTYDPDNYHPSVLAAEYWVDLNNAFWAGGALLTPPVGPIPMYLQTLDLRLGDSWSTSSWPKVQGQINAAGGLDAGNWYSTSTGRTTPYNLEEQLAMEEAQSNPAAGKHLQRVVLTDPRWPHSEGWRKMQQIINGVNIHYNLNVNTGETADWKFK
jgi:filamentous hemagglutinin